jgi:hypothetical protein
MQHDLTWVKHATWQLTISSWHVAKNIFLSTSHFFSLLSSSSILHQQNIPTHTPQPGENGTESRGSTGVTPNTLFSGTQSERKHQLIHRNAANAAANNVTQDAHFKIVLNTGRSKTKNQHPIGCEYIYITVNDGQQTVWYTVGIRKELRDQCIAAHNGKCPWSTKSFTRTVLEIEHRDVISCGIFVDTLRSKRPWEWTNRALISLEEATEAYIVEVIAKSHY